MPPSVPQSGGCAPGTRDLLLAAFAWWLTEHAVTGSKLRGPPWFVKRYRGDMAGTGDVAAPILISACLLGVDCTYRGGNETRFGLAAKLDGRAVVPVCPEVAGGLGVPRPRAEIEAGDGEGVLDGTRRVGTLDGLDVTDRYRLGARRAVELALETGAEFAVLKSRSPSCGPRGVYDGTHSRTMAPGGAGVTAAALRRAGLEVVDEDEAERRLGR